MRLKSDSAVTMGAGGDWAFRLHFFLKRISGWHGSTGNGVPLPMPPNWRCTVMFKTIHIKRHERGLWFRRGDFVDVLNPGTYRIPFWNFGRDHVQIVNTTS